jgi:hypothetical protein
MTKLKYWKLGRFGWLKFWQKPSIKEREIAKELMKLWHESNIITKVPRFGPNMYQRVYLDFVMAVKSGEGEI